MKDGSIAKSAGITVGDIICAFGDSQVTQNTDLQAALVATAAGSAVQIKVIRGATDMIFTANF